MMRSLITGALLQISLFCGCSRGLFQQVHLFLTGCTMFNFYNGLVCVFKDLGTILTGGALKMGRRRQKQGTYGAILSFVFCNIV